MTRRTLVRKANGKLWRSWFRRRWEILYALFERGDAKFQHDLVMGVYKGEL